MTSCALIAAFVLGGCGSAGVPAGTDGENLGEESQALGSFTRQMTFDMTDLLSKGRVVGTANAPFSEGQLLDVFDGNIESLARTFEVNPMVVTLAFDSSYTFKQTRMVLASPGTVTLEIANSLADLNAKTGSYVLAVNEGSCDPNTWGTFGFTATGKYVRATVTRHDGDNNVHLNEWELAANVTVSDIKVSPSSSVSTNAVKLLTGKSVQLKARYSDANKYTYPITDPQTWSSSNAGIANVTNTGRTTAGGTPGSATLTVAAGGVSQTVALSTLTSFTQTKDAARTKKVAVVLRDPLVPQHGNLPMHQVYGWQDPNVQVQEIAASFASASANALNYKIVETTNITASKLYSYFQGAPLTFNQLVGYYDAGAEYWKGLLADTTSETFYFDYAGFLADSGLCEKQNQGLIDEVWIYADPFGALAESLVAGNKGFHAQSPPVLGTTCNGLLPIMGLNYETGTTNAIHSFGHRLDAVMLHTFGRWNTMATPQNDWEKFATVDLDRPGFGGLGETHYPVNTQSGYEYNSETVVSSFEATWKYYPFLQDIGGTLNCNAWGCQETGYHEWRVNHLPRFTGVSDGRLNNWLLYLTDYEAAVKSATDQTLGIVGNTTLGFENTSGWTSSNGTKASNTTDGERVQGAASLKMTSVGSGVTLTSAALSSSAVTVAKVLALDVRVPTQLAGQNGAQVKLCLKSPQRGISSYVCSAQKSLNGIGVAAAPTFYTVPWTLPTATLNALKAGSFTDLQIQVVLSGVPAAAQSATWLFDRGRFFGQ